MIAILVSPIYLFVLIWATNRWYKFVNTLVIKNKKLNKLLKHMSLLMFVFTACIAVGFLLPNGVTKRIFTVIGNYWLAVSLYLIMGVAICELVRFIVKKKSKKYNDKQARFICVIATLIFTISMSVYGIINAKIIRTTSYDITINKKVEKFDSLKIGFIADTHFGYNIDEVHLSQVVDILNKEQCDIVIVGGDIFDNDYEAIENPNRLIELFNSIETKYGIYGVLGNHDIEEKILCGFTFNQNEEKRASRDMFNFLSKAHINILYDSYILLDDSVYVFGRPDYERPNFKFKKGQRIKSSDITTNKDLTKPFIVIDHEPRDYDILEEVGVDLDLSGHTHDGQIWPTKYFCYLAFKNPYGLYKHNNFHGITTSGVGLFGPNIRTFTIPEVTIINIKFAE